MGSRTTGILLLLGVLVLAGCVEASVDEEAYQELEAWAASVTTLHDPVIDDLEAVLDDPEVPQLQAVRHLAAVERALEDRDRLADSEEVRTWTLRPPRADGPEVLSGTDLDAVLTDLESSLETLRSVAEQVRDTSDRTDPQLERAVAAADRQAREARSRYREVLFGEDQEAS